MNRLERHLFDNFPDQSPHSSSQPSLREAIARRGRERAVRSGYDNDTQISRIQNHLDGAPTEAAPIL